MFRRNSTGDDICLLHPLWRNMYWFPPIVIPMCHCLDEIGLELLSQTNYMKSKGYFADLFTEKKSNYKQQSACKMNAFDDIAIIITAALSSLGITENYMNGDRRSCFKMFSSKSYTILKRYDSRNFFKPFPVVFISIEQPYIKHGLKFQVQEFFGKK